jgi:hypothetical protein
LVPERKCYRGPELDDRYGPRKLIVGLVSGLMEQQYMRGPKIEYAQRGRPRA